MTKQSALIPHPTATKDARASGMGGTDARRIAAGDWFALYQDKMGEKELPNLDFVWVARLGKETEKLHAFWHQHMTGDKVLFMPDNPTWRDGIDPIFFATYDFWIKEDDCPLELKHTHANNDLRMAATEYMAQLQLQMHVAGVTQLRFSIIRGNAEPEWGYVEYDPDYWAMLEKQMRAFWWHIENKTPPPADELKGKEARGIIAAKGKAVIINGLKPYDLSQDNAWVAAAADFIRDKAAAESLKITEPLIRGMIPEDAETVEGGGLRFKRDSRGAYRVTIDEQALEAARKRASFNIE